MQKRNSKTSSTSEATNIAFSTIDSVLDKGADRLYNRYITAKIPTHMSNDFHKTIHNIFKHIQASKGTEKSILTAVHESQLQKINLIDRSKTSLLLSKEQRESKMPKKIKKSFHLKQNSQQTRGTSRRTARNAISPQKTHERQFLSSQLTECPKTYLEETTSEDEVMWAQKQERDRQKQAKEEAVQRQLEETMRVRRRMQEQIKEFQQVNRALPFDYETGRFVQNSEKQVFQTVQPKKNIIFLKYDCVDSGDSRCQHPPKVSSVPSTRKITNFTRSKKKRVLLDEDLNDCDYNNNGQRQKSSVPFLDVSEGVQLREDNGNASEHRERANPRIHSASITHRTFKSYSREIMESNRFSKTICVSSEKPSRYEVGKTDKQAKKNQFGSRRNSILWKQPKSMKNHTIIKNTLLLQDYFQFKENQAQ